MIFEAGLVTFLRTILIIVLVYYGIKFLFKLLLPYIVKRFMQKQQEKFNQGNHSEPNNTARQSSNESNKDSTDKKGTLGDYVDYEEVE